MRACQKRIALRVAVAYHTTSTDALLLISGIPPIDLLALEQTEVEEARRNGKHLGIVKAEARTTLKTNGKIDGVIPKKENGREN
jgi:hypothetical protein